MNIWNALFAALYIHITTSLGIKHAKQQTEQVADMTWQPLGQQKKLKNTKTPDLKIVNMIASHIMTAFLIALLIIQEIAIKNNKLHHKEH